MNVNGPSFISFITGLYRTFNNIAEKAFPKSSVKRYGIDPADLKLSHGM